MRALIIEDNPLVLENLGGLLSDLGVEIVGSVKGEVEACAWLDNHPHAFDVAFVDVLLQGGSGLGVLRHIEDLAPSSKRIVLTNYASDDVRRECHELGVEQVFDKTNQLHKLLAWVSKNLNQPDG